MQKSDMTQVTDLVFVHGLYHGSWCWDEFSGYFIEAGYRCHFVDLKSAMGNDAGFGLDHYFNNLKQVIDTLDSKPVVIGHSLGGMLAQRYLEKDALPGVVFLATPDARALCVAFFKLVLRFPLRVLWGLITLNPGIIYGYGPIMRYLFFRSSSPTTEQLCAMEHITQEKESWWLIAQLPFFRSTRPRQPSNLLVVAGAEDPTVTVDCAERVAQAMGAESWVVEGMPHDLMLDVESGPLAKRILEWLQGCHGIPKPACDRGYNQ